MTHLPRPSSALDIADLLRIQDEALDRAERAFVTLSRCDNLVIAERIDPKQNQEGGIYG